MVASPTNPDPLTSAEFFAKNDDLAGRYATASPSARQNILGELYKLDLKLFQAWRILGDERDDYQQEAVIWLARALESFKPGKGPFVNWLRGYILKTFRSHVKTYKRKAERLPDDTETSDTVQETGNDPLFWRQVKATVTPQQWELIRLRFHEGRTIDEIATLKGTYKDRIRAPLLDAIQAVKVASFSTLSSPAKKISTLDPTESSWIPPQTLAIRLGLDLKQLHRICAPNIGKEICPFTIDPRDLLRLSRQRYRIRFLETDSGLIYPRFIPRDQNLGRAGYL